MNVLLDFIRVKIMLCLNNKLLVQSFASSCCQSKRFMKDIEQCKL